MMGMPRISARAGIVSSPPQFAGKWSFEVLLGCIGGGPGEVIICGRLFDTEEEARREMTKAVNEVSDAVQNAITGEASGDYIDLKTNEVRNWKELLH